MSAVVVDLGAAWLARAVQRIEDAEPGQVVGVCRSTGADLRRLHAAAALKGGRPFCRLHRAARRAGVPAAIATRLLAGDASAWVRQELALGPVRAADLAEAARQLGVRPAALRRALEKLHAVRTVSRWQALPGYSGRGVAKWSLPDGGGR